MNLWRFREWNRSITNLYYYFNVIWNDRDWDYAYIEVLQLKKFEKAYKFRTTSKYFMSSQDSDKENQALKICIDILKRRLDSWYTNIWSLHHGNNLNIDWIPVPNKDLVELKMTKKEGATPGYDVGGYHDKVEERDWKVLNDIIFKYQRRWWD
jgi:hypothetical protein